MATMIPNSLKGLQTTAGERKIFDLLKHTLPVTSIVRYEMIVSYQAHRPDFVIIDPSRGILVIEVKDWSVENIEKMGRQECVVKRMGVVVNPNFKAEKYIASIKEKLLAKEILYAEQWGELKVPLKHVVAFPNILVKEFEQAGYLQIIPRENILFKRDLGPQKFIARLNKILPLLSNPLNQQEMEAISAVLFPENTIEIRINTERFIPATQTKVITSSHLKEFQLSLEQELIAKSLGEGPRLLRGIAGTGKTLIMLYRAKLLTLQSERERPRILILCWNVSLANYMRQIFDKGFKFSPTATSLSSDNVVIKNFSEFIRELFQRYKVPFFNVEHYSFIKQLQKLESKIPEEEKFDAVYIDEGQDFMPEWLRFIYHNLIKGDPRSRNFLVAADDAQRIFRNRRFTWKEIGIPMRGRSQILKTIYRNSARIWVFAAFLLEERAAYWHENKDKLRFARKGGYDPVFIQRPNLDAQIDSVIEILKNLHKNNLAWRNVLILYRHKTVRGLPLVDRLKERLKEAEIPFEWIAQDRKARNNFDWYEESVKISTVHSAKGMDSPVVIILGADTFEESVEAGEDEVRVMYVAITRAREQVIILYSDKNSGLMPKLLHAQRQYNQYKRFIVALDS